MTPGCGLRQGGGFDRTGMRIAYHPGHVWRLLRQLGWSCQRPTGRALERDERAIARWKRKRWPEIKKSPKTRVRHRLRRRKRLSQRPIVAEPGHREARLPCCSITSIGNLVAMLV